MPSNSSPLAPEGVDSRNATEVVSVGSVLANIAALGQGYREELARANALAKGYAAKVVELRGIIDQLSARSAPSEGATTLVTDHETALMGSAAAMYTIPVDDEFAEEQEEAYKRLNDAISGALAEISALRLASRSEPPAAPSDDERRETLAATIWRAMQNAMGADAISISEAFERADALLAEWNAAPSTLSEDARDAARINWLEAQMTPKDRYVEVYLAGLRRGDADASAYQVESQPMRWPTMQGETLRAAMDAAMSASSSSEETPDGE